MPARNSSRTAARPLKTRISSAKPAAVPRMTMKKSDGTVTMIEFEIVVARLPVSQASG